MRALAVALAVAAAAAGVVLGLRRRAGKERERSEVYESEGMLRVGPVPDAPPGPGSQP